MPGGVVQWVDALSGAQVQRHRDLLAFASDDRQLRAIQLRVGRMPNDVRDRCELRGNTSVRFRDVQAPRGTDVYGGFAVRQRLLCRRRLL